MTYAVNVAENVEVFEVYNTKVFDQAPIDPNLAQALLKMELNHRVQTMLNQLLIQEADCQLLARRYEREGTRRDYRNGYYPRGLATSFGEFALRVPRARKKALHFKVFEVYRRRWRELDRVFLEAFIGGMSSRGVAARLAGAMGTSSSATTVAGLMEVIDEEIRAFRMRPLTDEYVGLILDGMYIRIKPCGKQKRPVVVIIGLKSDGGYDLLAFRVCYSENSTEVEGLLRDIKSRGVFGRNLTVITLDGDKGLEAAALAVYPYVRIQDCVFHKINRIHRHATSKKRGRKMMQEASSAFANSSLRDQQRALASFCDKWRPHEPYAIERFAERLDKCFEVYALPENLRSKASTSGACETLFSQLRLRLRSIGAFESPRSVERYVFALTKRKKWISLPEVFPNRPLSQSTHNY